MAATSGWEWLQLVAEVVNPAGAGSACRRPNEKLLSFVKRFYTFQNLSGKVGIKNLVRLS